MRLLCAFVLTALLWVLPVVLGQDGASAYLGVTPPASEQPLLHDAKIVCGDTGQGFKCRNEPGNVRRGKMRKIPGSSSGGSSEGPMESGDENALPPDPGDAGTYQRPAAAPASCPKNAELLGGHCIPYTQTCDAGLAANANPQPCRGAEEKQICSFRPDGRKDCCCRTYTKF